MPPYHLARTLASLDMLSEGRAAWNVVTSATDLESRNFGTDGIPPRMRDTTAPMRCWKPATHSGIAGTPTPS